MKLILQPFEPQPQPFAVQPQIKPALLPERKARIRLTPVVAEARLFHAL